MAGSVEAAVVRPEELVEGLLSLLLEQWQLEGIVGHIVRVVVLLGRQMLNVGVES
jgi:hypothetical protein